MLHYVEQMLQSNFKLRFTVASWNRIVTHSDICICVSEGMFMVNALEAKLEKAGWNGLDMCREEIVDTLDKGC